MYLLDYGTGEETYYGPFEKVTLDSVNDSGFVFLCTDDNESRRVHCSACFEIVKENYLEV